MSDAVETPKKRTKTPLLLALGAVGCLVLGAVAGRFLAPEETLNDAVQTGDGAEKHSTSREITDLLREELASADSLPFESEGIDLTTSQATVLNEATDEDSPMLLSARQIAIADEHLRAGNFAMAVRAYQLLRESATGPLHAALQYRIALCAETSGHFAEALEAYRQISSSRAPREWTGAARMGEARCLAAV